MSDSAPKTRQAMLERIEAIDAEMIALRRKVALEGGNHHAAWDALVAERAELRKASSLKLHPELQDDEDELI